MTQPSAKTPYMSVVTVVPRQTLKNTRVVGLTIEYHYDALLQHHATVTGAEWPLYYDLTPTDGSECNMLAHQIESQIRDVGVQNHTCVASVTTASHSI